MHDQPINMAYNYSSHVFFNNKINFSYLFFCLYSYSFCWIDFQVLSNVLYGSVHGAHRAEYGKQNDGFMWVIVYSLSEVRPHALPLIKFSLSLLLCLSPSLSLSLRWWASCGSTWTRSWSEIRSCLNWMTEQTPSRPVPLSLRPTLPSWRGSTGGRIARQGRGMWGGLTLIHIQKCKLVMWCTFILDKKKGLLLAHCACTLIYTISQSISVRAGYRNVTDASINSSNQTEWQCGFWCLILVPIKSPAVFNAKWCPVITQSEVSF